MSFGEEEKKFIFEKEHMEWVSLIVIVPIKNGNLRTCVNIKKVNEATTQENYPPSIIEHVIKRVAG